MEGQTGTHCRAKLGRFNDALFTEYIKTLCHETLKLTPEDERQKHG